MKIKHGMWRKWTNKNWDQHRKEINIGNILKEVKEIFGPITSLTC